ncbi:SCO-spondin-like isoform X2 [Haliotis asinina]|uniref:SCO-spondin-like isoform X2 n=1 Tax=Haliotis asinina TaxID=109174 RepID=UPI0035322CBF
MMSPLRYLFIPGILILINIGYSHQQVFQLTLKNTTIAPGGFGTLDVQVADGVTGSGAWSKDGNSLSSEQGKLMMAETGQYRQLILYNAGASDAGMYTFTINGQSTSAYLTVGVSGPVDGNWGNWSPWSGPSCPATCGPTARRDVTRSRTCTNPAPSNGGSSCPGQSSQTESQVCGPSSCAVAVNGNWGEWSPWSGPSCPATCGPTARRDVTRSRTCDRPAPSNGGAVCPGQNSQTESQVCGPSSCATSIFLITLSDQTRSVGGQVIFQVNLAQSGITGVWTKDGVNITADATHQIVSNSNAAILFIANLQVADSGRYSFTANGETTSAQLTVNAIPGVVNGNWGEWSPWSGPSCPATCGPTARRDVTRSRTCTNPAPSNGGSSCPGQNSQTESQACGPTSCGTIVFGLRNITIPVGQPVALQVTVTEAGLTGTWQRDGAIITGGSGYLISSPGNTQVLFFTKPQVSDSGRYTFTIRGDVTEAWLTVSGTPVNGNWAEWSQWIGPPCPATCGPTARRNLTRSRTCTNPAPSNGGSTCPGVDSGIQTEQCGPAACSTPVNGNWAEWSQWIGPPCPATCGPTARRNLTRSRTCTNPAPSNGGSTCPGADSGIQTEQCGPASCGTPVNGNWAEWSQWIGPPCPATCGPTARRNLTRSRTCTNPAPSNGGSICPGVDSGIQTEQCGPVTCGSSVISTQLQNVTRRVGEQVVFQISLTQTGLTGVWQKNDGAIPTDSRILVSNTGSIYLYINGVQVSDNGKYTFTVGGETVTAFLTVTSDSAVNGNWGDWSPWSGPSCPATCGPTARRDVTRSRTCTNPAPSNGGSTCPGQSSQTESQECGPSSCGTPVNGNWAEWSQWIGPPCPATCGPTARRNVTRSRTCTNPAPSNGGSTCPGVDSGIQTEQCGSATCGGVVSEWGNWNNPTCPETCGRAVYHTQKRTRTCINGTNCTETLEESRRVICMDRFCPVDGGFTQWSMWTTTRPCREICGPSLTRTLVRTRSCTNPAPSFGGRGCAGETQQTSEENCNLPVCGAIESHLQNQSAAAGGSVVFEVVLSQDNVVGYWQRNGITLTNSSKTRIESIGKTQKLTISNIEASDVGNYSFVVDGETTTAALTLRSTVPVDGGFSEWGTWTSGQCSVSCGNGLTTDTRNRTCTNPVPQNGGQHCSGPTAETRTSPCNRTCIVNGGYTQWSGWVVGSCTGSCDEGTQTDTRTRSCTNPRPQNGGRECAPPSSETRTTSCIMAECAIHGGMTEWGAWVNQSCTETCGKRATRTVDRHRNCSNPEPKHGGRPCTVHPYESKVVSCGLPDCPSTGASSFTLERGGLYIGLIAAIIAIGVFLIIIIVACCLWNCRKETTTSKVKIKDNHELLKIYHMDKDGF